MSATQGRQYELSQPEAGTCTVTFSNLSGAFNPQNSSSPFYPDVRPGVPLRVSAQFSGRRYPLWAGYVERWPQDWPEFPQWGWSNLVATDAVGVAGTVNMPSAVQGEILADQPYFCFPFGEQYSTSVNDLNGVVKTPAETDGLLAVNTSLVNQKTATYHDGNEPVVTGQPLGFLGDAGTGMGATGYTGFDTSGLRGPGVQYGPDYGLPLLQDSGAGDASFEMWFLPPSQTAPGTTQNVQLFELLVPPYLASDGAGGLGGGVFVMGGVSYRTDGTMVWYTQEAWSGLITAVTSNLAQGTLHHVLITMNSGSLNFWLDGVDYGAIGGMPLPNQLAGCAFGLTTYSYGNHGDNANFSIAYASMYPYEVSPTRIPAHYTAGISGFEGDTFTQRAGRYIAWTQLNLGLAGPVVTDHLQLSAEYSSGGSPMSDALNADAVSSGGLWYVCATGNLVVIPRPSLYNQASQITFGDDVSGGEIPYLTESGFDYDNTYLQNSVQVTLTQGPNQLATPVVRDFTSAYEYFQRGPLQQQVSAGTVEDATDRAWWSLNKYRQPALRVRSLNIDAAARSAVFTSLLPLGLGAAAVVNRRPLTQGSYSLPVVIGKIQHEIGPGKWDITYQMYPNVPEDGVLTADTATVDVLGSNVLAW